MSARLKETYRETYKRGTAKLRRELLPAAFPFTSKGWVIDEIEVMAAGRLADGREFQEIRIITRELTSLERRIEGTAKQ